MKRKPPRGRSSKRLSATIKPISSLEQIQHLDWSSKVHKRDAASSKEWQKKFLGKLGLVEEVEKQNAAGLSAAGIKYDLKYDELKIGKLSAMENEFNGRINEVFEDGKWVEKSGENWSEFIQKLRVKYDEYLLSSGKKFKVGKEGYQEPLMTMFFRLPPWLALVLKKQESNEVKKIMRGFVEEFSRATGYPVCGFNIHSESEHDIHLHIVYSEIVSKQKSKKMTGRGERRFLSAIREQVKLELKESGEKCDPASVRKKMDSMEIEIPEFEEYGKPVNQKIIKYGRGEASSWPAAKRRIKTIGSAYRYKGWIWDAAVGEDKKRIQHFREYDASSPSSFTSKFVKVEEKEDTFLDWWGEQELYRRLLESLSPADKKRVEANKKKAVRNYVQYGRTVLDPVEAVLFDEKEELKEKETKLAEDVEKLDDDANTLDLLKSVQEVAHTADVELLEEERSEIVSDAKKAGHKEVIEKVLEKLPPAKSDKTLDDVLGKVEEVSNNSILLGKILPELNTIIEKVLQMKKPVKWLLKSIKSVAKSLTGTQNYIKRNNL